MERTQGDIYVNIQGDEPTIRPDHIDLLLRPILSSQGEVTTLKVAIDAETATDPNVVKVVTDAEGRALYFSRLPIPFDRDAQGSSRYYKHIGLYGYTRSALSRFHSLPQSSLELTEKLEQLRLLENGIPILVSETPHDTVGVDTQADLERAAQFLAEEPWPAYLVGRCGFEVGLEVTVRLRTKSVSGSAFKTDSESDADFPCNLPLATCNP
jgi:3-deoxy-manno-octulosonate cytidylyltransferase (CMP-KDO synthetase)